jgi:hypothetical protein
MGSGIFSYGFAKTRNSYIRLEPRRGMQKNKEFAILALSHKLQPMVWKYKTGVMKSGNVERASLCAWRCRWNPDMCRTTTWRYRYIISITDYRI